MKSDTKKFLTELAKLMEKYKVDISTNHIESGCDCCGDVTELEVCVSSETVIFEEFIYPSDIRRKVEE